MILNHSCIWSKGFDRPVPTKALLMRETTLSISSVRCSHSRSSASDPTCAPKPNSPITCCVERRPDLNAKMLNKKAKKTKEQKCARCGPCTSIVPLLVQVIDQPILIVVSPPAAATAPAVVAQGDATVAPARGQKTGARARKNHKHVLLSISLCPTCVSLS
jgi:hypothetical protein